MKYLLFVLTIISITVIPGCTNKEKKVNENISNKKLKLIDTLKTYDSQNDSLYYARGNKNFKLKVVNYIDGTCLTCAEDLLYWKKIINELKDDQISYEFYFFTNDFENVKKFVRQWNINFPLYIDNKNSFYSTNKLNANKEYHSFIINSEREIIYDKNPVYDSAAFNYYMKKLPIYIKERNRTSYAE